MTRIGVFDSGLGGVCTLNELCGHMDADFYYLGDNLRVPYGGRSKAEIRKFSKDIVKFLEKFDIDYYIIACNTISVTAADFLRESFEKKFITITDAAIGAAETCKGDFLALATKATVESHFYKKTLEKKTGARVYEVAAARLVDLIESGSLESDVLDRALDEYLRLANERKIENIILACTHYPIIKDKIRKKLSYDVNIIDPAAYLASKFPAKSPKNRVNIYMTRKSAKTKELVDMIMDYDYEIEFVGDV